MESGEDIKLLDGSVLNIKINFYTIYLIQKLGLEDLIKKSKESATNQVEIAGQLIYCILRSNGRKDIMDEADAMMLVPPDATTIKKVFEDFQDEFEKYKKKDI